MKPRLLAVLLLLGCTHSPAPAPAPMELGKFVDAYYAAAFARSPSLATRIGFHEYDAKLEDYSRAGVEAEIASLRGLLKEFEAASPSPDRDIVLGAIRGGLLELETRRK